MEKKNLAMEALRKLINGEIRSQSRVNVVQTRAFSERLEEAIARYHSNAITTAGVIQELIKLAKDIRAAHIPVEEMRLQIMKRIKHSVINNCGFIAFTGRMDYP